MKFPEKAGQQRNKPVSEELFTIIRVDSRFRGFQVGFRTIDRKNVEFSIPVNLIWHTYVMPVSFDTWEMIHKNTNKRILSHNINTHK